MRHSFKFVCTIAACWPLSGWPQAFQSFPLHTIACDKLPEHAAVQECLKRDKAEYEEWVKQMKSRYPAAVFQPHDAERKPPSNCFKREATGEQICAN
ncbi:hypothetical protein B9Z39_08055 [Limnohabitans sp. JirII-29]|nr:hypothetical protein B9Z39_08055 [Limnohabitans sp. JirII-29]